MMAISHMDTKASASTNSERDHSQTGLMLLTFWKREGRTTE